jgi:multiphosphoryl transfer protein
VASGAHQADARSMNQLLALATQQGDELTFSATGPEAGRALAALGKLAAAGFAEPHGEPLPALAGARTATITTPADRQGLAVVGGVVYGPAALYRRPPATVRERAVSDPPAEWQRFTAALRAVRAELTQLQHTSAAWLGEEEAAIFTAQAALLDDPDLQQVAADLILGQRLNAEAAWLRVTNAVAQRFAQAEQSYWRQRAADLQDIQNQVVHYLLGMVHDGPQLTEPSILVAADLPPTVLARLPAERLLGLLVEEGGVASHTAIIARALGLPTVMGLPGVMNGIRAGQVIALDGDTGRVWLQPDRALRARLTTVRKQAAQRQAAAQDVAHLPATLRDGKPLPVMANLSTVQEAQRAIASGAEGVGLLRTEFLFINRLALPDEEEQVQAYTTIAAALAGRPLVIRTLDLGGDKPAPYLGRLAEANPELGWRGIRYWLAHGEIAHTQLRAILRVGAAYPVKILFPMVATLAELAQARQAVTMAQAELRGQGLPCANRLETGVMVETPAAVFLAPQLAACVDFFSIGTNDLTQFVMAADRNNPQVAALANAHQPAVLRAIQQTVQAAHQAGVRVTVCGEVASDPDVALLLIGLGVDELSVNLPAIPAIKSRLRGATLAQTIALAEAALEQETATAVIAELRKDSNW